MSSTKYPMIHSDYDKAWQRYCGFLDLTTEQFMGIQETLLLQQIGQVANSRIGKKLMGNRTPRSLEEFRHLVPLSSYQDYLAEFEQGETDALPSETYTWAHTSGGSGTFKRVPYTQEFYYNNLDNLMAAFILSCSSKKGQSSLTEGDRVLFNVAPYPYLSGILANGASEVFNMKPVMPADEHDGMDFKEKIANGFEVSLRTGTDILVAMTSVLVKLGNEFGDLSRSRKKSKRVVHPMVLYRYARALMKSKMEKRSILPKDLWPLKSIIGWGIDTSVYREQVRQSWGLYPYELHACTEAGIMALQSWSRRDLTLLPHSNFFEFIPEDELWQTRNNIFFQPRTVLLPEVIPGRRYELVITSFYGMPFIRYRLGHLIRITATEDNEAEVHLPQMVFETRADELIDIAGFTRISEKTIAQAIADIGLRCEDWLISKKINQNTTALQLYIEPNGERLPADVASRLHNQFSELDPGYRDLDRMMDLIPLEVITLRPGTFSDYYLKKKEAGAELTRRKPARMDPPEDVIGELLDISNTRHVLAVEQH